MVVVVMGMLVSVRRLFPLFFLPTVDALSSTARSRNARSNAVSLAAVRRQRNRAGSGAGFPTWLAAKLGVVLGRHAPRIRVDQPFACEKIASKRLFHCCAAVCADTRNPAPMIEARRSGPRMLCDGGLR